MPISYYRPLDLQKPHHVIPEDHVVVFDLLLGRIELRLKDGGIQLSYVQRNGHMRLTVEPILASQISVRIEHPVQEPTP